MRICVLRGEISQQEQYEPHALPMGFIETETAN